MAFALQSKRSAGSAYNFKNDVGYLLGLLESVEGLSQSDLDQINRIRRAARMVDMKPQELAGTGGGTK